MSEQTSETLVYMGKRLTQKGALSHAYLDSSDQVAIFGPKRDPKHVIGATYEVPTTAEGNYRLGEAERVKAPGADERTTQWRLDAAADKAKHGVKRADAKLRADHGDIGDMTLRQARYSLGRGSSRPVRLAIIIDYLTK